MVAPDPAIEKRIREAAERLLSGRPNVVNSDRLSVAELALEADVSRSSLYRAYKTVRKEFEGRVEEVTAEPPPASKREEQLLDDVERLTADVDELKERIAQLTSDKGQWKRASEAFIRVINLLEREKQQLEVKVETDARRIARQMKSISELRSRLLEYGESASSRPSLTVLPGVVRDDPNEVGDPADMGDEDE